MTLNFDSLAPFTNLETLYPSVRFSSPGNSVYVYQPSDPTECRSPFNMLSRGVGFQLNHFADLYIDFPQPVNNLTFYASAVDTIFGSIAQLDYYRNGFPPV